VMHVSPKVDQSLRYLEVREIFSRDPDVLETRHELAVEAAHRVAGEETRSLATEVLVDLSQMSHQRRRFRILVLLLRVQQKKFQFTEQIFHEGRNLFVLHEKIVAAGYVLHYVSLDLLVLENRLAVVDENRRRCGLKIRAKVRRWFLHVDRRDFKRYCLELGEQVQVHEVLLAEKTGALPSAVYRGCLDYKLYLRHVTVARAILVAIVRHFATIKRLTDYGKITNEFR